MARTKHLTVEQLAQQVKRAQLEEMQPHLEQIKGAAMACLRQACNPFKKRVVTEIMTVTFTDGTIKKTVIKKELPQSIEAAIALIGIIDSVYKDFE